MKKILTVLIAVAVLCTVFGLAMANSMDDMYDVMYVNCENGKTLNLRDAPGGNVIGSLECGTKLYIDTEFISMEWSKVITTKGKTGFVMTKFLQEKKPGKYEITERDDNFVAVKKPYIVNAKALNAKTDRSVGLRIKPNKTSKAYRRLDAGDQLQVIAEGTTWIQVLDLSTGKIGYVADDYMEFDHYLEDEETETEEAGTEEVPADAEME